MAPLPKHLLALAAAALLSGCVPVVERYRHIALEETNGVTVTAIGLPAPAGTTPVGVRAIPLEYRLQRDTYALVMWVDPTRWGGELLLEPEPADRLRLEVFDPVPSATNCAAALPPDTVYRPLSWLFHIDHCGGKTPQKPVIRLRVLDADGAVLGEEALPFTVRNNGFYIRADGI